MEVAERAGGVEHAAELVLAAELVALKLVATAVATTPKSHRPETELPTQEVAAEAAHFAAQRITPAEAVAAAS